MVYTTADQPSSEITVELTRGFADRPQPVSVRLNGFDYAGEVIFSDQWQAWFGSGLPDRVMFRLVLLSEPQRVDRADISEKQIAVALPPAEGLSYRTPELTQLDRELGRLNEIRERYIVSGDYELHSLTSSLIDRTSQARRDITDALAQRWRAGEVVLGHQHGGATVSPDSIFVGDDPVAWIEAVAATLFAGEAVPAGAGSEPFDADEVYRQMLEDEELAWRPAIDGRIRQGAGVGLDGIFDELDAAAARDPERRITGDELRSRLVRQRGLPPGLAALVVIAFLKLRRGEASLAGADSGPGNRLDSHSLGTFEFDPDLVFSVAWLSPEHSGDWNSALPYIRELLPNAQPSTSDAPPVDSETAFAQALEVAETRNALTLRTLESVVGRRADSLAAVKLARRLAPALETDSWQRFYSRATELFPNLADFSKAVAESARLRVLSEDIVDIQAAHDYVAAADFGRFDKSLESRAASLLGTLDVGAILESRSSAAAELEAFQAWKRQFTGSYIEHHADRRSRDLELERDVRQADSDHEALRKFVTIPELEDVYEPSFERVWEELKERVRPCSRGDHEVELQRQPFCVECGVRLGSSGHGDEVRQRIAEIDGMLRQCVTRLSTIAAPRILASERGDETQKLIDINAISDLLAVRHVLDDTVLDFLKQFAGGPNGAAPGAE